MDWQNRPASVRIYVSAVVGGGVAVYLGALYRTFRLGSSMPPEELVSLLGILLVAGLSARWVVRIPRTTNWMAVADCLIISIVMIYGLAPGIIAHGLFNLVSYWFAVEREPQEHRGIPLGWSRLRAVFNLSSGALQALVYGSVFIAVKPAEPVTAPQIFFPVLLVGLTYFLVNGLATHVAQALSGQAAFWELWRQDFPLLPAYFIASACGAAIVYLFHQVVGPGAFALALPFWVVAYYAHRFYKEKYEELAKVHTQTLEAFAFCIDAMELHTDFKHHTHTHIQRTQALTLGLARALNVDEKTYEGLRYASVLHDVGKISIPSYILHKPTRLTEREFQKMSTHPAVGAQILASIDFPFPVVSIVKHHHENWDGSGYPDGLRREEIPLGSRVLAIADCYEALTARRVYRRSLSREAAVAIMKREAHKFDPDVFKRFLDVLPALEEELNSIEVRSLAEPKEHTDSKRDRDIVGQPKSVTLSSSNLRAPAGNLHLVRDLPEHRQLFVAERYSHHPRLEAREDRPLHHPRHLSR